MSSMRTIFSGVMKLLLMPVGRGEIGAVPKLYGDVAVVGGHPAELPHLVADVAKFDP